MYRQSAKNLLSSNISSTYPHNMVNFGPLAAEILSLVWGTPANFNGFRFLAALLHSSLVVGITQTLWLWTEGSTYIRQGGHHVEHWPTFLVISVLSSAYITFCNIVQNHVEIGRAIIFLPCGFFLSFSSSSFFSSPNLSGRRLDVYHTSTHGVALVWI